MQSTEKKTVWPGTLTPEEWSHLKCATSTALLLGASSVIAGTLLCAAVWLLRVVTGLH